MCLPVSVCVSVCEGVRVGNEADNRTYLFANLSQKTLYA